MNIGFFDFPIKKEKNKIYSNSGRLIIDLKNSSSQEKDEFFNLLFDFISEFLELFKDFKLVSYKIHVPIPR